MVGKLLRSEIRACSGNIDDGHAATVKSSQVEAEQDCIVLRMHLKVALEEIQRLHTLLRDRGATEEEVGFDIALMVRDAAIGKNTTSPSNGFTEKKTVQKGSPNKSYLEKSPDCDAYQFYLESELPRVVSCDSGAEADSEREEIGADTAKARTGDDDLDNAQAGDANLDNAQVGDANLENAQGDWDADLEEAGDEGRSSEESESVQAGKKLYAFDILTKAAYGFEETAEKSQTEAARAVEEETHEQAPQVFKESTHKQSAEVIKESTHTKRAPEKIEEETQSTQTSEPIKKDAGGILFVSAEPPQNEEFATGVADTQLSPGVSEQHATSSGIEATVVSSKYESLRRAEEEMSRKFFGCAPSSTEINVNPLETSNTITEPLHSPISVATELGGSPLDTNLVSVTSGPSSDPFPATKTSLDCVLRTCEDSSQKGSAGAPVSSLPVRVGAENLRKSSTETTTKGMSSRIFPKAESAGPSPALQYRAMEFPRASKVGFGARFFTTACPPPMAGKNNFLRTAKPATFYSGTMTVRRDDNNSTTTEEGSGRNYCAERSSAEDQRLKMSCSVAEATEKTRGNSSARSMSSFPLLGNLPSPMTASAGFSTRGSAFATRVSSGGLSALQYPRFEKQPQIRTVMTPEATTRTTNSFGTTGSLLVPPKGSTARIRKEMLMT